MITEVLFLALTLYVLLNNIPFLAQWPFQDIMNMIVDVQNILNDGEFLEDSFDTLKQNIGHQIKDDQS